MAISRPVLLALIGLALLGATLFAVNNARNSGDDVATPSANQPPADQATPAPQPSASPEDLLVSGLSADVESASFDAKLTFTSQGERNLLRAFGSFEDNGPKAMPEVDLRVHVDIASLGLDERGGFVTTGDRAWFTRGRAAYTVPQSIWSEIVKARESGAAPATASSDLDLNPRGWLKNVRSEGTEQIDGVQATHLSARVDSAKAITEVVAPAMRQAGSDVPLGTAERRLRQAGVLKNGELDVWVGEDKIFRRMTFTMSGRGDGGRAVTVDFDFRLSGVGEPQDVARPANVKKGMPGGMYGQVANGLLGGVAEMAGLDPQELRIGVPVTNSHVKAERAIADNKKVVIFFQNPRALDDRAVAVSVRSLDRRTKKVVVLTDDVRNSDRYGSLLENLQVSQAPAIVVIGRSGKAELVEGYVDAGTLVQVVADAR